MSFPVKRSSSWSQSWNFRKISGWVFKDLPIRVKTCKFLNIHTTTQTESIFTRIYIEIMTMILFAPIYESVQLLALKSICEVEFHLIFLSTISNLSWPFGKMNFLLLIFYLRNVAAYEFYGESQLISCYECIEYIIEDGHEFYREDKNDRDCQKLKKSSYGTKSSLQYSNIFAKEKYRTIQTNCLFAESAGTVIKTEFPMIM